MIQESLQQHDNNSGNDISVLLLLFSQSQAAAHTPNNQPQKGRHIKALKPKAAAEAGLPPLLLLLPVVNSVLRRSNRRERAAFEAVLCWLSYQNSSLSKAISLLLLLLLLSLRRQRASHTALQSKRILVMATTTPIPAEIFFRKVFLRSLCPHGGNNELVHGHMCGGRRLCNEPYYKMHRTAKSLIIALCLATLLAFRV